MMEFLLIILGVIGVWIICFNTMAFTVRRKMIDDYFEVIFDLHDRMAAAVRSKEIDKDDAEVIYFKIGTLSKSFDSYTHPYNKLILMPWLMLPSNRWSDYPGFSQHVLEIQSAISEVKIAKLSTQF